MALDLMRKRKGIFYKFKQTLLDNRYFLIFLLFWIIVFSSLRTAQHFSFRTNTYDLSIFDYTMSYTLRGELMAEPFHGYWGSHFAHHFYPLLFLLVPFYLIFKGPLFLLYIQVFACALSGLVLYLIAKNIFPVKFIPSFIAITYLLYRPFLNGLMYDFHPEMFFPLFLFLSVYFISIKRRPVLYFVFITLALSIKEDIAIFVFFFGIFLFFKVKENRKIGLITAGYALLYFIVVLEVIIPHFRSRLGMPGKFEYFVLWGGGDNIFEVSKNLFLKGPYLVKSLPWATIGSKLFNIFAALLFIPFFTSYILLAFPPIIILASSQSPIMQGFGLHYMANILPFLFIAFVYGLKNVERLLIKMKKPIKILIYISLTIFLINIFNTKWELLRISRYSAIKDYKVLSAYISSIPDDASVASLSSIIPHIPKRKNIHMLPTTNEADYILVHSGINLWPYNREDFNLFLEKIKTEGNYVCIQEKDEIQLFRRKELDSPPSK